MESPRSANANIRIEGIMGILKCVNISLFVKRIVHLFRQIELLSNEKTFWLIEEMRPFEKYESLRPLRILRIYYSCFTPSD